ncbi:MAG: hypothetical protein KF794_10830 [Xanthobacteraceae bacterium]|nr:hypothetical protein [Xanthobacteraceae bacterium]QYK44277.1 MAG: hypothetical protein KF794_10830 [Xanthobacteraceae bacterium]
MRKITALSFAAALAATALPPVSAEAAQIRSYKVANWDVGVYTDDNTGRFSHCAAAVRYRNGYLLLFSVSHNLEWAVGFSNPDWRMNPGRETEVEFRVDSYRIYRVTGRAVNNSLVRATLPDSVELFNQFRFGSRLYASISGGSVAQFNLTSTAVMLTEILRCANQNKNYTGDRGSDRNRNTPPDDNYGNRGYDPNRGSDRNRNTQPDDNYGNRGYDPNRGGDRNRNTQPDDNYGNRGYDPDRVKPRNNDGGTRDRGGDLGGNRNVRSERGTGDLRDRNDFQPDRNVDNKRERDTVRQANLPDAATGPTPQTREEAGRLATNILRRANISGQLQRPDELAPNFRTKYDAVWRADGTIGTLRILAGGRASTIEKIRGDVIASDAGTCKGKFASGALPAADNSRSVTVFTSCEGEQNWSVYYIAVPRSGGGIYLLGVFGSGEAGNRLQNLTNMYRTAALEVLER